MPTGPAPKRGLTDEESVKNDRVRARAHPRRYMQEGKQPIGLSAGKESP